MCGVYRAKMFRYILIAFNTILKHISLYALPLSELGRQVHYPKLIKLRVHRLSKLLKQSCNCRYHLLGRAVTLYSGHRAYLWISINTKNIDFFSYTPLTR